MVPDSINHTLTATFGVSPAEEEDAATAGEEGGGAGGGEADNGRGIGGKGAGGEGQEWTSFNPPASAQVPPRDKRLVTKRDYSYSSVHEAEPVLDDDFTEEPLLSDHPSSTNAFVPPFLLGALRSAQVSVFSRSLLGIIGLFYGVLLVPRRSCMYANTSPALSEKVP